MAGSGYLKRALIGCAVLSGVTLLAGVAAVAFGGWALERWVSNIVADEDSDYGREIARLRSAHRFSPAADGTIGEGQLERFLAVCRNWLEYRQRNAPRFREMQESLAGKDDKLGWVLFYLRFGSELRDQFLLAVKAQSMSFEEYRYLHAAVVKAQLASLGGELRESLRQSGGNPPGLPEALRDLPDPALREALGELEKVPPANVERVRRHAAELERLLPVAPMAGLLFPLLTGEDSSPYW